MLLLLLAGERAQPFALGLLVFTAVSSAPLLFSLSPLPASGAAAPFTGVGAVCVRREANGFITNGAELLLIILVPLPVDVELLEPHTVQIKS